jgi:hypothetical protein
MAIKHDNATAAPRNSTGGVIQVLTNGNLLFEPSTQQASALLANKDLVRNLQGMIPKDQKKFIDKVDQV